MKQAHALQSNDYDLRGLKHLLEHLANAGWETKAVIQEGRHAGLVLMEREVVIDEQPDA